MVAILTARGETARENAALKRAFQTLGLDPVHVTEPAENPEDENGQLEILLRWALAYRACPDRKKLEKRGFLFPPVEPAWDPEADWHRFERWMKGQPTNWTYASEFGPLKRPEELDDGEIEKELNRVVKNLSGRGVEVEFQEGVPARLSYAYLKKEVEKEPFEFLVPGAFIHIDGCGGSCPDCFQRPWCEFAAERKKAV
jgi:hypothetical protein